MAFCTACSDCCTAFCTGAVGACGHAPPTPSAWSLRAPSCAAAAAPVGAAAQGVVPLGDHSAGQTGPAAGRPALLLCRFDSCGPGSTFSSNGRACCCTSAVLQWCGKPGRAVVCPAHSLSRRYAAGYFHDRCAWLDSLHGSQVVPQHLGAAAVFSPFSIISTRARYGHLDVARCSFRRAQHEPSYSKPAVMLCQQHWRCRDVAASWHWH